MGLSSSLDLFLPPVGQWFAEALGEPTPAQRLGWPRIAAGENTLILAPTGSGKTLAAFLACLDALWRQTELSSGVQVLYVSPLKALNNDIHKNLQVPLAGVIETARRLDYPLRELTAAVRTGDTPVSERQKLLRRPPHVLITTPESLNLILTSQAREMLRGVRFCIVDEIHALCANKRGVFLSILMERLEALNPASFVRIGLSATQRPLDEVARFLGGVQPGASTARPVTIVDAGLRKDLDLQVVSPVSQFGPLPERSVWPSVYRLLAGEVRRHRSTIIFTNNRRTAERVTTNLNELDADGEPGLISDFGFRISDLVPEPEIPVPKSEIRKVSESEIRNPKSEMGKPPLLARAHHGSVSLEVRRQIEEALKEGRLPAVVATASLELGIDMGAVDLVCQVESPGSVARGLQRVGRAGHLVGRESKGRLIPKTLPDLIEQAVLAREMLAGRVEEIRVPANCLDVLAQQVVAMVAVESWHVPELYALVRQAYPYRDLSPEAFEGVLEMISGRYPSEGFRDLRPRISWDRVHNRLHALPGSRQLALVNGGTIPDTGQYAAYFGSPSPPWGRGQGEEAPGRAEGGVRIGELDEEFVYERRIGDVFVLGTTPWRIDQIEADRVLVSRAEGMPAMMPFWRGEKVARSRDLGLALGRFLRELVERLPRRDCLDWLQSECRLDADAARNLRDYVKRQVERAGCVPTDQTLLIESFRDQLGDWHVAVLSPFGSRFNLALRLIIEARLRERYGYQPQCLHDDDGLLLRLADVEEPPLDLLDDLSPEEAERLILRELIDSALFAIRFRQNAARALLLPRVRPDKRAPLYLQRLRARSLLQIARQHPSFPVVVETYRECLQDHLDLPRVQELLKEIAAGRVRVVKRRAEAPSPFAGSLLFGFTMAYMYDYDRVDNRPATQGTTNPIDRSMLEQILTPAEHVHLLDPRAVQQVERRLRGVGRPPRTVEEMAEWLRRLGDVSPSELEGPMPRFLEELEQAGRAERITLPGVPEPQRWILTEEHANYVSAFGPAGPPAEDRAGGKETEDAAGAILRRFLQTHALVGLEDILRRYPFDERWAARQLQAWVESGAAIELKPTQDFQATQWSAPSNLEQVQRGSLAVARREVLSCPPRQFAHFLLRWQHRHPRTRKQGVEGLRAALPRLQGLPLAAELWESVVLPGRVEGYQTRWLDELCQTGEWLWVAHGESGGTLLTAFLEREHLPRFADPAAKRPSEPLDAETQRVYEHLRQRGACFLVDVAQALGLPPTRVRTALWTLLRRAIAGNDRFDVIRRGEEINGEGDGGSRPLSLRTLRRQRVQRPEGRWSLIPWQVPDTETQAIEQAYLLLERYGVVARELALLDPWLLPWRVLYEVLSRLEWTGEVRRGYFVEGLSGTQFALPEAAKELAEAVVPAHAAEPVILLNSMDPANVYGSSAPFGVTLPGEPGELGDLGDQDRTFVRRPGNWLALRGGRIVLIVEGHGKRITTLAGATEEDVAQSVACLGELLKTGHGIDLRGKVTVEEWNGRPVAAGEGKALLEAAGFVRDYQAMALYAAWS